MVHDHSSAHAKHLIVGTHGRVCTGQMVQLMTRELQSKDIHIFANNIKKNPTGELEHNGQKPLHQRLSFPFTLGKKERHSPFSEVSELEVSVTVRTGIMKQPSDCHSQNLGSETIKKE